MTGPRITVRVNPAARIAVRAALADRLRVVLPVAGSFDPVPSPVPALLMSDILVMGHSLVDDRIMDALRSWAMLDGRAVDIRQGITPGASAAWHWDHAPAKGVEGRAWLAAPGVDLFSYAEAGPLNALTGSAEAPSLPIDYGNRWAQAAWANGARPFVVEIWPYIDSGLPGYIGSERSGGEPLEALLWRPKLAALRAHYEGIIGYAQARAPEGAEPFRLIPGGALLAALHDAALAGALTGIEPTEAAFFTAVFSDDIHLTPYGWYALACLYYACFYQRSPLGLGRVWYHSDWEGQIAYDGLPTAVQAAELQAIAWAVAQADPLGPLKATVPADPYATTGTGGAAEWWAPADHPLQLAVPAETPAVTAATLAWSFRYSAGAFDTGGLPTEFFFGSQFSKINLVGGDDATGRGLGSELVNADWSQIVTLANVAPWDNFLRPGEVYGFALLIDAAAGLSGGDTVQLWVNGALVKRFAGALSNIMLARLHMFANYDGTAFTPGETQGWWISLTTAVPVATLQAELFDAAGLRTLDATTIGGVSPDWMQIGAPVAMQ